MKRVIKHQKKMKNTMYIVFGVFALALFAITRANPSYASDGLILDDALDMIAGGNTTENLSPENKEGEEKQTIEGEDITEPEIIMEDKIEDEGEEAQEIDGEGIEDTDEGDSNEIFQDSEDIDLEGIGEKKEDNNTNLVSHGVSTENIDNEEEIDLTNLGDFEFSKMDNPNLGILNGNEFTVTYYPNGGAFSGMEINETKEFTYNYSGTDIIPIYNIQIPNRQADDISQQSGWMFAGWYTKSGENNDWGEEFDISNPQSTKAYAKWLPFNDLVVSLLGQEFIIMDRNLGAEDVAQGVYKEENGGVLEGSEKLGYAFQLGNNYGFKNSGDNVIYDENQFERVDGKIFGPGNYYYSNIYKADDNYSYFTNNDKMWGGNADNSFFDRKGPCPMGYHIPSSEEFDVLYKKFLADKPIQCNYLGEFNCFNKIFKIPYFNTLSYNSGVPTSDGVRVSSTYIGGTSTSFWLSDNKYFFLKYNGDGGVYNSDTWRNNSGFPVRCFKNFEKKYNMSIDKNNGEETLIYSVDWWKNTSFIKPSNPNKKGYTFDGWLNKETGDDYMFNDIIVSDTEILAKWIKNPWYTFNTSIGRFSDGEKNRTLKYEKTLVDTKYSHTDNLDDDENRYGNYNNKTYDKIGVIKIPGAIKLEVKIKYYGNKSSQGDDVFVVWTGSHDDYTVLGNMESSILSLSGWDDYGFNTYELTGDSITIGFKSFEGSYGPGYGYYIKVDGYKYSTEDQLEVPTIQGYEFLGWYETGALELFDFTGTEVTQDRTFYAKWNANTYTVSFNADNGEVNPGNITVIYDSQYPELPVVNKTGYTFSGWYNGEEIVSSGDIVKIIEDVTLKAKRNINQYKIIFDTDGGTEIDSIQLDYDSIIPRLQTPTKECNEFSGWDTELPERMPAHDITLKAIWNYTCSKSSGGGGEKKSEPSTSEVTNDTTDEHNSATDDNTIKTSDTITQLNEETSKEVISVTQEITEDGTEVEVVLEAVAIKNTDIVATVRTEIPVNGISSSTSSSSRHTKEENEAYSFAKSNGITTTSDIETAKMNTDVTRIQMAKMLSNYATNVLGKEPDASKGTVKFNDVTNKMDEQYDNAVTKAYQLGIMGQNVKNNEFRPNDEVTRAEFTTALSRLLYSTEEGKNKGTGKYYIPHIAKLYNEGIINKADPILKEKRGYVMTMLMRTVK